MTDSGGTLTAMRAFDYDLPSQLIAQTPLERRSDSRLLVLDRSVDEVRHRSFGDISTLLSPGDLLVVNDSRVIPARLTGERQSGGVVEFLLLRQVEGSLWRALIRPAKRLRSGEVVRFRSHHDDGSRVGEATVVEKLAGGEAIVELASDLSGDLINFGRIPLPPYITEHLENDDRYQTVYAAQPGSVAAPTAGLHFTRETLEDLAEHGINVQPVTLHVGLDTFRPITEEFAEQHTIHEEWYSMPKGTSDAIADTRERGKRVVAVGTTAARTLEAYARAGDPSRREPFSGMTGIFITPGYSWKLVDAMITNFHLPRSTLLLMISSFAGQGRIMGVYQVAIAEGYRFFSFGDAMLIL